MSKIVVRSSGRQLEFRFEGDEVWRCLPQPIGWQCQSLLTQLLVTVIRLESASLQEGNSHERQD